MKHTILDHIIMFFWQRKHTRKRKAGSLAWIKYNEPVTRTFYDNFRHVTWGKKSEKKDWIIGSSGGAQIHPEKDPWYTQPELSSALTKFIARYDPETITHWDGVKYPRDISCSKINTADTFSQLYGIFEVCATLPEDKATWAAPLWLHGPDWLPEMGFEEVEGEHGLVKFYMIWRENGEIKRTKQIIRVEEAYQNHLHAFTIKWKPNRIIMYVDGFPVFRMSRRKILNKFNVPLFLNSNIDIKQEMISNVQGYYAEFLMDYIAVYKFTK